MSVLDIAQLMFKYPQMLLAGMFLGATAASAFDGLLKTWQQRTAAKPTPREPIWPVVRVVEIRREGFALPLTPEDIALIDAIDAACQQVFIRDLLFEKRNCNTLLKQRRSLLWGDLSPEQRLNIVRGERFTYYGEDI